MVCAALYTFSASALETSCGLSLVWDSRDRGQWLISWVAAGSFDWFPTVCLPLLIVYLRSGTAARPLAELRQEDNIL